MSRKATIRVLVLDADMVPALTIARSLERRGCLVTVASHVPKPIASYSHAVDASWQYPDPLTARDEFVQWIAQNAGTDNYDLVIPVTERTLVPLSRCRQQLLRVKVAMPSEQSLELVLDKSKTMALAEGLGIPVPVSTLVKSVEDLERIPDSLQFPVVIKPTRSLGSKGGQSNPVHVSYAFDAVELRNDCQHALRFGDVLLQKYFTGQGVGVELIAQGGKIVYAFQHRRLHEVPLTGGGSSLRKSEALLPQLLQASRELVAALNWNGVAMVEFKHDPVSEEFCLMEINGRFWGSLPLADAAGVDFPSMLLDLELQGQVGPCKPYRENIFCRLLSRDLSWYEAVVRGDVRDKIVRIPPMPEVLRELGIIFSPRHNFDVQSFRDPLPGAIDLQRIILSYARRLSALFGERKFKRVQQQRWSKGEVERAVARADSMLFLCYGNINRSALADVMIRAYAEDAGVGVTSCGFHPEEGRRADPVMSEVAADNGLDMTKLSSTLVTADMVAGSDIIFVMEKSHYDRLSHMCPDAVDRIYLLGAHQNDSGWPAEIEDPYGGARAGYTACFQRIEAAVHCIKAMIATRSID